MSLEALKPRTDYELKMDILIEEVKTQVSNFNTVAIRSGARDMHSYNILRLRDELVKGMEAAKADLHERKTD